VKFVDEVVITVRSGKGGDGCVAFLHEKYRAFGGPAGGDGGHGGDVVLVADAQRGTLLDLRFHPHQRAESGENGRGKDQYGHGGESKRIPVPVGTIVSDAESGEILGDLTVAGTELVVARGGKGGRGNIHFATSVNQAPRKAEKGEPAEERRLRLSLKLIADVGLVGFPNAGKSTLISRISAAKPKIADYPFTTLTPNLGIVRTDAERSFVVADIPGLIAGAAEGAGLGHRFLRHIERVSALAIMLDVGFEPDRHPVTDYATLIHELGAYSAGLLDKPRVLVLTKADLPDTSAAVDDVRALADQEGLRFFVISAVRGDGVSELLYALQELVDAGRAARGPEAIAPELEGDLDADAEADAPEPGTS
jgi:GTP-binding protein